VSGPRGRKPGGPTGRGYPAGATGARMKAPSEYFRLPAIVGRCDGTDNGGLLTTKSAKITKAEGWAGTDGRIGTYATHGTHGTYDARWSGGGAGSGQAGE